MTDKNFFGDALDAFNEDCSLFVRAVSLPAETATNHINATLLDWAYASRIRYNCALDQARLYDDFLRLKAAYSNSSSSAEKYIYLYLCSIQMLPMPERAAKMFYATAFIGGSPEDAKTKIVERMRQACEAGLFDSGGKSRQVH